MVGKVRGMRNIHGLDFKEVGEASVFLRFLLLWFVAFDDKCVLLGKWPIVVLPSL